MNYPATPWAFTNTSSRIRAFCRYIFEAGDSLGWHFGKYANNESEAISASTV
ncbi:hypothetical protein [Polaromonas aquatica]|uniref:Uncharacterized protein n=1 Tax=Polaromonas aquatica TaxID=332657 RepID=A0ABW1TVE5_9BURK